MENEYLIGVQKNHYGEIMNFQTNTGRIISYRKAVQEIEQGILSGYDVLPNEQSLPRIHAVSMDTNTLNELPPF
ncbi:hypothetical protein GCM10008967_43180 [Bacillus carboniphilus]|uniref:DUF3892 domain-containing protein n=1 Tax=Bacillus carboniphilus TaxID=86663 RepID=A0ABN0WW24_9BACI